MEIPNIMKIFIGIIVIVFMVAIFWLTSWQNYDNQKKDLDKQIADINTEIGTINKQKEEIPKLRADISNLERELQATIQQELTPESETEFVPSYMADVE